MSDDGDRWVTVREASDLTRKCERTIRLWIEKQAVAVRRVGPAKRILIDRRTIEVETSGTTS